MSMWSSFGPDGGYLDDGRLSSFVPEIARVARSSLRCLSRHSCASAL